MKGDDTGAQWRPRRPVNDDVPVRGQIIVALSTLAGGVLAYLLQSRTAALQRRHQIADRTRAERLQAAAALPPALVWYRHAQLARRSDQIKTGARNVALDNELRQARAEAWAALYRFELLVDDEPVRVSAYQLMDRLRELKTIADRARLDDAGTNIHWQIQDFVKLTRTRLALTDAADAPQGEPRSSA